MLPSQVLRLSASEFAVNDAILAQAERERAEDLQVAMMKAGAGDRDPLGVGRVILALSHLVVEG